MLSTNEFSIMIIIFNNKQMICDSHDKYESPMMSSPERIKTQSPEHKKLSYFNRTTPRPILALKLRQATTAIKTKNTGPSELQRLKHHNQSLQNELQQRMKCLPSTSLRETSQLKDRIIEQQRIISCYRLTVQKHKHNIQSQSNEVCKDKTHVNLKHMLNEKQKVIEQLKSIVNVLTQLSPKDERTDSEVIQQLRDKVKVLTIENNRLADIINRISIKDHTTEVGNTLGQKLETTAAEIDRLNLQTELMRITTPLKQSIVSLQKQVKELEGVQHKNRMLEKENTTLIKLLKEQKQSKVYQKNSQEQGVAKMLDDVKLLRDKTTSEKVSITKIKEQYNENMRLFMDTVHTEVNKEFKKFDERFQEMKLKLDKLQRVSASNWQELDSPIISRFNPAQTSKRLLTLTSFEDTQGGKAELQPTSQNVRIEENSRSYVDSLDIHIQERPLSHEIGKEAAIKTLQKELEQKNELLLEQQRKLDKLCRELEEQKDQYLKIINSKFDSDTLFKEKEIAELKKIHQREMEQTRANVQNQLIDIVNSYNEKMEALRNTIHHQSINLLRAEGDNQRLRSQLRLAKIDLTPTLLGTQSKKVAGLTQVIATPQMNTTTLQRLTEVISQTDSQPLQKLEREELSVMMLATVDNEKTDLRQSVEKFKVVVDNLIVENSMIPELKNRIQTLQSELLNLQESVGVVGRRITTLEKA